MAVLVVMAEERSALAANAPTAAAITAAFRRARLAGGAQDRGDWLGPAPRIVRTATVGERFGTWAAWVYAWPTDAPAGGWSLGPPSDALGQELVNNLARELAGVSGGWQTVTATDYARAVNGGLEWWASGEASSTRTRDEFPTGTGRLDASENPRGPTTDATHPSTPGQVLGAVGGAAESAVWGVVILGGLYLLTRD